LTTGLRAALAFAFAATGFFLLTTFLGAAFFAGFVLAVLLVTFRRGCGRGFLADRAVRVAVFLRTVLRAMIVLARCSRADKHLTPVLRQC
jgi:hypothetical protein